MNLNEGRSAITIWKPDTNKERTQKHIPDPLCILEPSLEEKSFPEMQELTPVQKQKFQEEREDDDLEMNIQSAGKDRDLSPRQIADLKSGYKKNRTGQTMVPLQVKTRRSKEREDINF